MKNIAAVILIIIVVLIIGYIVLKVTGLWGNLGLTFLGNGGSAALGSGNQNSSNAVTVNNGGGSGSNAGSGTGLPNDSALTTDQLAQYGVIPAQTGVNPWQWTDANGTIWYGSAQSLLMMAQAQ